MTNTRSSRDAAISIALVLPMLVAPLSPAHAAGKSDSSRTDNRFGLITSFDGGPVPSSVGESLGLNLSSWLRVDAGVGGYNDQLNPQNWGKGFLNYTFRPLFWSAIVGTLYLLETIFYVPFVGHYSNPLPYGKFMPPDYITGQRLFTYGGGANLFVPGWNLSPTAGIHWAEYSSSGISNLNSTGSHLYYNFGLDWQTKGGFNIGSGFDVCPNVSVYCGFYVNLGLFF